MFVAERRSQIVSLINKAGRVRVKELSEMFEVTQDCIRKDLSVLENEGLLRKTYGGAVSVRINTHDYNVAQRINKNVGEKMKIAENAMKLIKENDLIFLDISTCSIELAKLLARSSIHVTVVTNMVDVMNEFMTDTNLEFIFIGGRFTKGNDGFVGQMTADFLSSFRFDIAFMGVVGLDLNENAVLTYTPEDGKTKNYAMQLSRRKYMMLEETKFNQDGTYQYARASDFTGLVLKSEPSKELAKRIAKYSLEVIY